jgi:hypothetical protein
LIILYMQYREPTKTISIRGTFLRPLRAGYSPAGGSSTNIIERTISTGLRGISHGTLLGVTGRARYLSRQHHCSVPRKYTVRISIGTQVTKPLKHPVFQLGDSRRMKAWYSKAIVRLATTASYLVRLITQYFANCMFLHRAFSYNYIIQTKETYVY